MSSSLTSTISASLTPEYDALWHKLHPLQHEMIITGVGRRVYPLLEYQFSGMNPEKMYTTSVHFEYVDDKKLRFCKGKYVESVSQEKKEAPRKVQHKSGAKLGSKWMAAPVNFEESESQIERREKTRMAQIYLPVLTISEEGGSSYEIRLSHTVFITATLYHVSFKIYRSTKNNLLNFQIDEVCKIKTESNEYAKSNREDRRRSRAVESSVTSPPAKKSRKEASSQDTSVQVVPDVPNSIPSLSAIDPALMSTLPFPSAGLSTQVPTSSAMPTIQDVPPANPLNAFSAIPWLNPLNNPYLLAAMGLQFPTIPFPYLPSKSFAQLTPTSSTSPDSQPTQPENPVKTAFIDKVIKDEVNV
ncbi:Protein CBG08958 [Caenorhabditis briggsae]|uniref:Protein CBG08958 n=1 Tax=Caenorhabditis briggsae TaxID=6238 RepID=A8X850_CAEBR|nr:Protein CBG08958 [Caenorhabditis briggsae]CAP28811.2 Protein CBG08958 [Caenorhabditis briggsae]